jgi:hypothetical protein
MLVWLSEKNREHPLRRYLPESQGTPEAGVFFSGFKSRFRQYDSVYSPGIDIPTMHVLGERDTIVTVEQSWSLVTVSRRAFAVKHPGGHDVPCLDKDRERISRFLQDYVGEYSSEASRRA